MSLKTSFKSIFSNCPFSFNFNLSYLFMFVVVSFTTTHSIIGYGSSIKNARTDAYTILAQQFSTSVSTSSQLKNTLQNENYSSKMSEDISLNSDFDSKFTTIVKQGYDKDLGQYFVVLELDERKYSEYLQNLIQENNNQISAYANQEGLFDQFIHLKRAYRLSLQNQDYINALRYLNNKTTPNSYSPSELQDKIHSIKSNLTVSMNVPTLFQSSVKRGMGDFVFVSEGNFEIRGKYDMDKISDDVMNHRLELVLVETKNNRTIFNINIDEKSLDYHPVSLNYKIYEELQNILESK